MLDESYSWVVEAGSRGGLEAAVAGLDLPITSNLLVLLPGGELQSAYRRQPSEQVCRHCKHSGRIPGGAGELEGVGAVGGGGGQADQAGGGQVGAAQRPHRGNLGCC